jgi:hypothetical protein
MLMVAGGTPPRNRTLRILLVVILWASVDIPSLALGILRMDALASTIADDITRRILDWGPDVVGSTSAFQQKITSLAVA